MQRKEISEADFDGYLAQEYPDDLDWKAFFKLWLDANGFDYGERDQHIVDGPGDGGIDAIAYPPHGHTELPIVVVQSKYYKKKIPAIQLKSFIQAVEAFQSDSKKDFESWIEKVKRKPLKTLYRDLWPKRHSITFVLLTSGDIEESSLRKLRKLKVQIEDRRKIRAVFFDMMRGKSPRPKQIKLDIIGEVLELKKAKDHSMHVFVSKLQSFAKAYQDEKKNLFAGNVRYAIKGTSEVKLGIKNTLDHRPEEFAYFHNGITIVCRDLEEFESKVILHSPSVVNGAQTVSYIGEVYGESVSSKASVLVKVIVVNESIGFEKYETDVAMSSNTQNKVSLSDLSVIDPDLVTIEKFFRATKCFLERKKGDFPLGKVRLKINKDQLLQLFASLDKNIGPAATKDKQSLYKSHSARLFREYAKSIEDKRDAVFLAFIEKFIQSSLREFNAGYRNKKRRRLNLSKFVIFATTCQLIEDKKMWRKLRQAALSEGLSESQYAKALDIDIRKIANAVLSYARKDEDRNETAFFKNKDKVAGCLKYLRKNLARRVSFHKA